MGERSTWCSKYNSSINPLNPVVVENLCDQRLLDGWGIDVDFNNDKVVDGAERLERTQRVCLSVLGRFNGHIKVSVRNGHTRRVSEGRKKASMAGAEALYT
jgi:hypothetical protein